MKVIFTEQSFRSLEELQKFMLVELDYPLEKVLMIRSTLLDRAESLTTNHKIYQEEQYLAHLEKHHQRIIEGHIKIIYRVEGNNIFITDFFDSRQDPSKMKG